MSEENITVQVEKIYDFLPNQDIGVADIAAIWTAAQLAVGEAIYERLPDKTKVHFLERK